MENGELLCHGLTKVYSDSQGKKALDGVTLSVQARGIFSLIGMNGAGKTTLVRILATQLEPTSGDAQLCGMDVVRDAKKLRKMIASIPQEARSIPWMTPMQTVSSYLLWRGVPYTEGKSCAAEALAKVGIEEQRDTLNRKLSGGQRRKVMVAAVLAANSDITFLDEPTTGLDPLSRKELWRSLEELAKKRFLILTTHYLEEAEQLADTIGVLDRGMLAGIGTLDQLRSLVRYQYSVRLPVGVAVPELKDGTITRGREGQVQILTGEEEAYNISRELLRTGARISVSRISLDDIFFHFVGEQGGN
ncbi:MAG TPA: ABC transporter ATP-binding protein [Nitrososphaerales archaeon]|nr:ABC transporter ATP-binding protein [Nitrososphaerales archaeon]